MRASDWSPATVLLTWNSGPVLPASVSVPPVAVSVTCTGLPPASSTTEIRLPLAADSMIGTSSVVVWLPGMLMIGAALAAFGTTWIRSTSRSPSAPPGPLLPRSLDSISRYAGPA